MSSGIEDEIAEWLNEGGRPLEMQVAAQLEQEARHVFGSEFRSAPWTLDVVQLPFFEDPDEHKPREIDVVGVFWDRSNRNRLVSVVIKCRAGAAPFVILLPSEFRRYEFRCESLDCRHDGPSDTSRAAVDLKQLNSLRA